MSFNIPDEAIGRKYLWSFEMKGHYCFFSYLDSTNEEVLFHQIPILRPMKCYHSLFWHKLNNFLVIFFLKSRKIYEVIWICSLYHLIFFLDPNLLKLLEFRINILILVKYFFQYFPMYFQDGWISKLCMSMHLIYYKKDFTLRFTDSWYLYEWTHTWN